MKYNIDIYLDSKALIKKYEAKIEAAQMRLKQVVVEDTDPFVPFESGYLKNSVADSLNDALPRIIYQGPYAHYLYTGYVMVDPDTKSPWAKKGAIKEYKDPMQALQFKRGMSEWFEHSKNLYTKRWIKEVEKVIKS